MNKNDLKYDPEFPYLLVNVDSEPHSRWALRYEAESYLQGNWEGYGRVIDTTPKPKIPEDAKHITWGTKYVVYSKFLDGLWYGWNHGRGLTEEQLLGWIGDSEVVVLVTKEDA